MIEEKQDRWKEALLNRASLLLSTVQYQEALRDATRYLGLEEPIVQGYVVFASCLIKLRTVVDGEQK